MSVGIWTVSIVFIYNTIYTYWMRATTFMFYDIWKDRGVSRWKIEACFRDGLHALDSQSSCVLYRIPDAMPKLWRQTFVRNWISERLPLPKNIAKTLQRELFAEPWSGYGLSLLAHARAKIRIGYWCDSSKLSEKIHISFAAWHADRRKERGFAVTFNF